MSAAPKPPPDISWLTMADLPSYGLPGRWRLLVAVIPTTIGLCLLAANVVRANPVWANVVGGVLVVAYWFGAAVGRLWSDFH